MPSLVTMICLNSKGLPLLEELKNLRAITLEDMSKEKDIIEEIRENRANRLADLKVTIGEHNPKALFADGHDDAIMGYSSDGKVIYSVNQIMETLVERDGMTPDEAIEFFNFNIECAYVGEYTPIYMYEE